MRNSNYRVDLLVEHVVDEYVGHGGLQLQQTEKQNVLSFADFQPGSWRIFALEKTLIYYKKIICIYAYH